MKVSEKIWWTKIVAALGVSFLTLTVQVYLNVPGSIVFMLGVILYMGLSDLLSRINRVDRFRVLKIGVGAYFFTWIVTWVALYTFLQTMG